MASPEKPRRPWYRPHFSTWIVTALVALFFCFWNVAGYYRDGETSFDSVWIYGWPETYLKQAAEFSGFPYSRRVDDGLVLNLGKPVEEFRVPAFCLNAGAGLVICLVLGAGFEIWRRRRAHPFQIYLGELGLLTLFIAGILGCGRYLIMASDANRDALQESQSSTSISTQSVLPEWIHQRLASNRYSRWHWMMLSSRYTSTSRSIRSRCGPSAASGASARWK